MDKHFVHILKNGKRVILSEQTLWFYGIDKAIPDIFAVKLTFINGKDQWLDFSSRAKRTDFLRELDTYFGI